jgi:hypothetical protein
MRRTKAAMMVATVAALTVLPLATTATAQAAARTPEGLNCSTDSLRHEKFNGAALVYTYQAFADCTNPTDRTIKFRVNVVCGLALDETGDWVTLQPYTSRASPHARRRAPGWWRWGAPVGGV